tara:strand:+ start:127 stop:1059 length:933 start_codon:yes stop_codon:yes gene_type:complete
MAFLDNSGDIILDAVLTDTGRHRLAMGDGSFRITKFALGDDEINYTLYDKNHASGSAYYDLNILQTPVLEAFTNNTSLMKSKLISIPRTNLLYLPILKQNAIQPDTQIYGALKNDGYLILVDEDTEKRAKPETAGVLNGATPNSNPNKIRVDQGLDTTEIPASFPLDADLVETQYIVEIDNRFGQIYSPLGAGTAKVSFIDDDQIASYYFSFNTDTSFVRTPEQILNNDPNNGNAINGPRGTIIELRLKASIDLNSSTFLFTQLGGEVTYNLGVASDTFYYIDSIIRISGATTGYRIDLPVRFLKLKTAG